MTSRDLVPQGLPHGERQNIEQARERAGLANSTNPATPPALPDPRAVRPARPARSRDTVQALDALQGRTPTLPPLTGVIGTGAPVNPVDSFRQRALASPNPILRSIAEILPEFQ